MKRLWLLFYLLPLSLYAQTAGPAAAGGGNFRVIRSVSGSEGVLQNGRYTVTDPRSVFHVPADKKVIVYFDWEGPVGDHHFEGYWKNPEGKVVILSDYKYKATQRRFGGYWELDLTPDTMPGVWSLEARIDGEVTGSHSFQIVQSSEAVAVPARHMLQPSEVYKKLLASSIRLQRLDAAGHTTGNGLGVVLEHGYVATAFQVIDGASTLRLTFPDGRSIQNPTVAWWDRLRDVAVLRADTAATPALDRAAAGSWSIGDRVFALDVSSEGMVIKEESIFGLNDNPTRGPRINATELHSPASAGGALVNEYGEMIGVMGGAMVPGMIGATSYARNIQWMSQSTQGSLATPISVLPAPLPATGDHTLAELAQSGQFIPPLVTNDELLYGALGDEIKPVKGQPFVGSRQQKNEFSKTQGKLGVQLSWSPRAKLKGILFLRLYDLRNRLVFESKPLQLKLSSGQMAASDWNLDISPLPTGNYRIDVFLDDSPIWRAFFVVTD